MYVSNHWLRLQIEAFLRSTGINEPVIQQDAWPRASPRLLLPDEPPELVAPGHFDLTERSYGLPQLGVDRRHPKGRVPAFVRSPSAIDRFCYHQMAAEFGVSKRRVAFWAARAASLPPELLEQYCLRDLLSDDACRAFGQRMALHERMCGLPYHVAGLLSGDVVHINPLLLHTYHGDGANARAIAIASDGSYPGVESRRSRSHTALTDFMVDTLKAATMVAMIKAQELGIDIRYADAHRVYSAHRVGDPGEAIWKAVVLWAVKEYDLKVDYEKRVAKGKPIPAEWDPAGLVDYKGRPVRKAA